MEASLQYSIPQNDLFKYVRSFRLKNKLLEEEAEKVDFSRKLCPKCKEVKKLEEFYSRKDRKIGIRSWCKACCKKVVLVEQHERRKEGKCILCNEPSFGKSLCPVCGKKNMISGFERRREYKKRAVELLGGKCQDCGFKTDYFGIYTFHHLDPKKKDMNIGRAIKGWDKFEVELHKCILLCERCHRIRHSKYKSTCIDKQSLISMERHRKNKRLAVEYKGNICLDCGFKSETMSVFDFHHRNVIEKEIKMSELLNGTFERIKKEIDKCDLLCCNCHIIRHINLRLNRGEADAQ